MNYYELLGIGRTASLEKIKQVKNDLLRATHPDKIDALIQRYANSGDADLLRNLQAQKTEAQRKTQEINQAWETLSDPDKRRRYDRTIFSAIVFNGAVVDFGTISPSQVAVMSLVVTNQGQPLTEPCFVTLETQSPEFAIEIVDHRGVKHPAQQRISPVLPLTINLKVQSPVRGEHANKIKLVFDGMAYAIPAIFKIGDPPRLTASPVSFDLGTFYRGEKTARKLTLTNSGGTPTQIRAYWQRPSQRTPRIPVTYVFPMVIEIPIDSTNCLPGGYREVLILEADTQRLEVTVTFEVEDGTSSPQRLPPYPP